MSPQNRFTFFLAKEKTWIITKSYRKKIMPSKATVNWLFNDVWYYFLIASFDWKIGVFQQTVVRVYYILNTEPPAQVFFYKFCEIFKSIFLWNTSGGCFFTAAKREYILDTFWKNALRIVECNVESKVSQLLSGRHTA